MQSVPDAPIETAPESRFTVDLAPGEKPPKGFLSGKSVVAACALFVLILGGFNVTSAIVGRARDDRLGNDAKVVYSSAVTETITEVDGGMTQTLTANTQQDIDSIHRHSEGLLQIRRNVGDYSVPGLKTVPGREILESNIDKITVTLQKTAQGSTLSYTSKTPEYVRELRKWGQAIAQDRLRREQ